MHVGGERSAIALAENYITSDLVGLRKESASLGGVTGAGLAKIIMMIKRGELSSRGAKDTLAILYAEGGDPEVIAKEKGFVQQNDEGSLRGMVSKIMNENPSMVAEYRSGKVAVLQSFIGQGMKLSRGSANPEMIKNLFEEALKS